MIARRRRLPPLAAVPEQHRGRVSLRHLLRDDWRLAAADAPLFLSSTTPAPRTAASAKDAA